MALVRYRALTRAGAREAGVLDAPTPDAASATLRSRGLIVLDVSAADAHLDSLERALAAAISRSSRVRSRHSCQQGCRSRVR